jgi:DNA polymerase III epsilon subunit-like protein
MGIHYYTIDTETNGLKASYHEMTEISIIRASDRVQLTRMIRCLYPERSNVDALEITNKTYQDLIVGPSREEVVEECDRFFNEDGLTPAHRCIVGHNVIAFDKRFLHALWESVGREFPANLWLDTIALTKEYIKRADPSTLNIKKTATGKVSKKLQDACDALGIKKLSAAHASKVDARNTYLLWKKLTEEKSIDHLPFHKTFVHSINKNNGLADIKDLDMSDVFIEGESDDSFDN